MCKVSIVIPTYNNAAFLQETISTIFIQDYNDYEIIVVDDASTDNTEDFVNSIGSEKIKYIRLPDNHGGPSRPRNIGINNAIGDYIAFFDSDDLMLPGRIKQSVNFLDKFPDLGMVFTDSFKFDEKTGVQPGSFLSGYNRFKNTNKYYLSDSRSIINIPDAYICLFYENFILPSGVTVRKKVFESVGLFDERLTNGDDRDMWFRITKMFPIGFIDFQSFKYRLSQGSISKRGAILAENRIKVLRKQLDLDLPDIAKKQAHRLISRNLYGIGYHYRRQGDFKKARKYFSHSLQESFNWPSIKGYLATFLGHAILAKLAER